MLNLMVGIDFRNNAYLEADKWDFWVGMDLAIGEFFLLQSELKAKTAISNDAVVKSYYQHI